MVRLRLRKDVIATGERGGYQARCTRSCPRAASAVHTPCMRHAHAMQAPCIRYATQATPHLMLYVLHEPIAAEGDLPVARRLLLTSANLSAAPWGYARGEQLRMGQSARARHPPTRPAAAAGGRRRLPKTSGLHEAALWGRRQQGPRILWEPKRGCGAARCPNWPPIPRGYLLSL